MKHEDSEVTDDEYLVRIVHEFKFTRSGSGLRLKAGVFKPSSSDTDGLSFFRLDCLQVPIESLDSMKAENRHLFGLVKVAVATIRSLGWDVVNNREPRCPGHVIVPQINDADYCKDQGDFRAKLNKLKNEAELSIIQLPSKFAEKQA